MNASGDNGPVPGHDVPLDLSIPAAIGEVTAAAPARRHGDAKRVLVADDNRDAAETVAMLLSLHGHDVRVTADGVETLAAVRSFAPHVVLMDIGMPRMNGYDVARAVRELDLPHAVRLIALTGWGQSADRTRALDAGFDAHLTKPPEIRQLLADIAG